MCSTLVPLVEPSALSSAPRKSSHSTAEAVPYYLVSEECRQYHQTRKSPARWLHSPTFWPIWPCSTTLPSFSGKLNAAHLAAHLGSTEGNASWAAVGDMTLTGHCSAPMWSLGGQYCGLVSNWVLIVTSSSKPCHFPSSYTSECFSMKWQNSGSSVTGAGPGLALHPHTIPAYLGATAMWKVFQCATHLLQRRKLERHSLHGWEHVNTARPWSASSTNPTGHASLSTLLSLVWFRYASPVSQATCSTMTVAGERPIGTRPHHPHPI